MESACQKNVFPVINANSSRTYYYISDLTSASDLYLIYILACLYFVYILYFCIVSFIFCHFIFCRTPHKDYGGTSMEREEGREKLLFYSRLITCGINYISSCQDSLTAFVFSMEKYVLLTQSIYRKNFFV